MKDKFNPSHQRYLFLPVCPVLWEVLCGGIMNQAIEECCFPSRCDVSWRAVNQQWPKPSPLRGAGAGGAEPRGPWLRGGCAERAGGPAEGAPPGSAPEDPPDVQCPAAGLWLAVKGTSPPTPLPAALGRPRSPCCTQWHRFYLQDLLSIGILHKVKDNTGLGQQTREPSAKH